MHSRQAEQANHEVEFLVAQQFLLLVPEYDFRGVYGYGVHLLLKHKCPLCLCNVRLHQCLSTAANGSIYQRKR